MRVTKRQGHTVSFDREKMTKYVETTIEGLHDAFPARIVESAVNQIYDGITSVQLNDVLALTCKTLTIEDPVYAYAGSRFILNNIYRESFGHKLAKPRFSEDYKKAFGENVKILIAEGILSPKLVETYDLAVLAEALCPNRDLKFKQLGIVTLYDAYLLKVGSRRLETPQAFYMRVAMGLCLNEAKPEEAAIAAYNLFSTFRLSPSTPTLFNSGTMRSQLSSCFLATVDDSIDGIFGNLHQMAKLSKYAGGLGNDISNVRASGSHIKGTNGESSGVVRWLKCHNAMVTAVDQGGKRAGSEVFYLEPHHIDTEDFLNVRKNTGDDRLRCHDLNTALWISDLFMKRVQEDKEWTLFCPHEAKGLHEIYGEEFERLYESYEEKAKAGTLRHKTISAKTLWKRVLVSLKETGHPWICFKDPSNARYANAHEGVVHSSNLCCVAGDQRVVTDRGLLTVKELADLGGRNVLMGRAGKVNASEMVLTIPNSPMVLVTTEAGYTHKITPDHPLWVVAKGWVEAKDLKYYDEIELQQVKGVWGIEESLEAARLAGVYCRQHKLVAIPEFVWKSTEATVKSFLAALMEGEECNLLPSIGIAQSAQILYANLGVLSKIDLTSSGVRLLLLPGRFMATRVQSVTAVPNEDAYCLMVDSNDRAWTCNGLITKNTEILLHTKPTKWDEVTMEVTDEGEIAVCNLSSVNLAGHVEQGNINFEKLDETVKTAIRLLDNVIDINYYPVPAARIANQKHRPVGLGVMGWADVCHAAKLKIDSDEATTFADELQERISYYAIEASIELAKERGAYSTYQGSTWSQGKLPIDTYADFVAKHRPKAVDRGSSALDWNSLRGKLLEHGMRNSCLMAIAPTATISYIQGCSPTIEPEFSVMFSYDRKSGSFPIISEYFVNEMKVLNLWNAEMARTILSNNGDISSIKSIPKNVRDRYCEIYKRDVYKLIDQNARRQKWIDMGQSFNIFYDGPAGKAMHEIYFYCWEQSLKCSYYLRSRASSRVEKSTVPSAPAHLEASGSSCSVEAARLGQSCESCQ